MKPSAPRNGFQVYLSDAGYVCIVQKRGDPVFDREPLIFHPDEVPSLLEALEETRQQALDYVPPEEEESEVES